MTIVKYLIVPLVISLLFTSCKSEEKDPPKAPTASGCFILRFKPWYVDHPFSDTRFYTNDKCPDSSLRMGSEFVDFLVTDTVLAQLVNYVPGHSDLEDDSQIMQKMDNTDNYCELEALYIPGNGKTRVFVLNNLHDTLRKYLMCIQMVLLYNHLIDAYYYVSSMDATVAERTPKKL